MLSTKGGKRFSLFGNKLYLSFPSATNDSKNPIEPLVLVDSLVAYKDPETGRVEEILVFFQRNGNLLVVINLSTSTAHIIRPYTRPNSMFNPDELKIKHMFLPSKNVWILQDLKDEFHIAQWETGKLPGKTSPDAKLYITVYPITRLPRSLVNVQSNRNAPRAALPRYDYMSPIGPQATHLNASAAADPIRHNVFSYFMESGFQRLLAPSDDTRAEEIPIYAFPRPLAEETNTLVTNLHSIFLRTTNQLLTLTESEPFKGNDTALSLSLSRSFFVDVSARTRAEEEAVHPRYIELLNFETKTVKVIHLDPSPSLESSSPSTLKEESGRGKGLSPGLPSGSLRSLVRQDSKTQYMKGYPARPNEVVKLVELPETGDIALLFEDGIIRIYEVRVLFYSILVKKTNFLYCFRLTRAH